MWKELYQAGVEAPVGNSGRMVMVCGSHLERIKISSQLEASRLLEEGPFIPELDSSKANAPFLLSKK